MKIEWNKVTSYSRILALALFLILPVVGFYFGSWYQKKVDATQLVQEVRTSPNKLQQIVNTDECSSVSDGICPAWCVAGSDYDCCVESGNQWIEGRGCFPPKTEIQLISPNGGGMFCLGEDVIIEWESREIEAVKVWLEKVAVGNTLIGDFPATYNEEGIKGKGRISWNTIKTAAYPVREGFNYKIFIQGGTSENPFAIEDRSDNVFSIIRCEG